MVSRQSPFKSNAKKGKIGAAKKPASSVKTVPPLKANGTTIAVTLFGKLKETDPMYTAAAIDALFTKQQGELDDRERKKKLALETIKTIAALGQSSSLYDTINVVKTIGNALQGLYDSIYNGVPDEP